MSTRRSTSNPVLWLIFTVSLAFGFLLLFLFISEPRLQGRPATAWIRDLTRGDAHERAMQVLRSEGEKAIPALVRAMDRKRPTLASWLMQLPFHDRFPTSIRNWAMQRTRIQELERSWVIRISGLLGAENKAVQRALEQALGDPDPSVRGSAAKALVRTHADPARTLPQLGALLSDPDPGARSDAAVAIGMYGPSANSMLASVQALTNDADMAVAFHARLAVAMIETPERVTVRTNELGDITFQYAK